MTCLIVAGGIILDESKVLSKIPKYDYVITADSGYDNACKLSIKADVLIGDLDSIQSSPDIETIKLKAEKDETDLKVATDFAIDKGYSKIIYLAATGGRIDHMLCNISLLEYADTKGIEAEIIDEINVVSYLSGKQVFESKSKYVSVIPTSEKIIFSAKGLKYKAENLEVKRCEVVSVSNEPVSEFFEIEILQGQAIIVQAD